MVNHSFFELPFSPGINGLLLGFLGFFGFFGFFGLVAPLEPLYASGGIEHLMLAGEEGVAFAAHFYLQHLFRGTGSEAIATGTNNLGVRIKLRMYLFLHN